MVYGFSCCRWAQYLRYSKRRDIMAGMAKKTTVFCIVSLNMNVESFKEIQNVIVDILPLNHQKHIILSLNFYQVIPVQPANPSPFLPSFYLNPSTPIQNAQLIDISHMLVTLIWLLQSGIILMGVCYSQQQQQWEAYKQARKTRPKRARKDKTSSIIYEEKTIYESSFASNAYASFRDDLHQTISSLALQNGEAIMGSVVQMKQSELQVLYKSLHKINPQGEPHLLSDNLILCNLKTKNYLHTHIIKHPECKTLNEVSCCPYNSNHIPEYDIWKFVQVEPQYRIQPQQPLELDSGDQSIDVYIYHPFTQRFLAYEKGMVVGSENRAIWRVHSYGPRRNGGFLKITNLAEGGQLCMSEQKALLDKHRRAELCSQKHVSHIWELMFIDPELV